MNKHEHSYGIVPLRRSLDGEFWEILIVQHASAHYWGLPKGHSEKGESPKQAASRELNEETGLSVLSFLSDEGFDQEYVFKMRGVRIEKKVTYFLAVVVGEVYLQREEVSASNWVPLQEVFSHLTYETDRTVCKKALQLLTSLK